nr:hypothetical protein [Tanacetum cinerariifolium]GEW89459.1 hypothetical protein [Tanacetum cinerariifolium]
MDSDESHQSRPLYPASTTSILMKAYRHRKKPGFNIVTCSQLEIDDMLSREIMSLFKIKQGLSEMGSNNVTGDEIESSEGQDDGEGGADKEGLAYDEGH